jgi:hypothetical protein
VRPVTLDPQRSLAAVSRLDDEITGLLKLRRRRRLTFSDRVACR